MEMVCRIVCLLSEAYVECGVADVWRILRVYGDDRIDGSRCDTCSFGAGISVGRDFPDLSGRASLFVFPFLRGIQPVDQEER